MKSWKRALSLLLVLLMCLSLLPASALAEGEEELIAAEAEQEVLLPDLRGGKASEIRAAIQDGITVLAICGGYQMLGQYYETHDGIRCDFIGALDLYTKGLLSDLKTTAERPGWILLSSRLRMLLSDTATTERTRQRASGTEMFSEVTAMALFFQRTRSSVINYCLS